ncbi:MAG: hypothetical protein ACE5G0_07020 [Rhodothermales bacterium]
MFLVRRIVLQGSIRGWSGFLKTLGEDFLRPLFADFLFALQKSIDGHKQDGSQCDETQEGQENKESIVVHLDGVQGTGEAGTTAAQTHNAAMLIRGDEQGVCVLSR